MKLDSVLEPPDLSSDCLRGRDIICFSHDWTGDPLSKTHFMRLLAQDNRILWVNSIGYRAPTASKADLSRAFKKVAAAMAPIKEVEPNLFVFNPLAIPAYGRPALRDLSRRLLRAQILRAMRRLGFKKPINWVFNPAAGIIAGTLDEEFLIYHCVDEYTAFTGVAAQSLAEIESQLLRKADAVFVSAERLYQSKAAVNPRTFLVRHGVDYEHFRQSLNPSLPIPDEIAHLKKPIIGYFGLIAEDWVDLRLLKHIADCFPECSLVMLGKTTMDVSSLAARPNVHLLGRRHYEDLPAYSKAFDVALIPFPISEVTLNANPLKAREYLASGLPVISTAIPEVEVLGQCRIGRDHDEVVREIRAALAEPGPCPARSETMRKESWTARLEEVRMHLAGLPEFEKVRAPRVGARG
ncbi:glycosyltransferase [Singulisphaera sp. PoT]|uniref:glycosyltransferase n=1 Tax=Singulisphaera sp. PoT TaxID=3411797 RepID=UPI003BF5671D